MPPAASPPGSPDFARQPPGATAALVLGDGTVFWGRGIGTKAVAAFLQKEQTRPLYADPAVSNTASVRLLERLGFERLEIVTYGDRQHVMLVLGLTRSGTTTASSSDEA